ncbi:MAG: pyridoxal-phosphate-dependent aminotransferase family protein [Candidatus Omnitrophota bacterium]
MQKNYLLTPGPTALPPDVCAALGRPIIHHRTPQFKRVLAEADQGLKYLFRTKNDVFILTSSGTGAMEAAVTNLLSPGDLALVIEGGKFGERWTEICRAYGIDTHAIRVEWGRAVSVSEIKLRIKAEGRRLKAVFVTHCETSTGVTNDIKKIAAVVAGTDAVLVVDAISSLGVLPLETDNWGLDVVVSGSQKGLMLPPGLGFITLGKRAWQVIKRGTACPNYYFSLKRAKQAYDLSDTPWTPGINLIVALNQSLALLKNEGLDNLFSRYKKMARAARAAAEALGLALLAAPDAASDAVTAIKLPAGIDGVKLVKAMRDEQGVAVAGGQGKLKGRIVRIAHMGYISKFDIIVAISCLEAQLLKMGHNLELGAGVRAASSILD